MLTKKQIRKFCYILIISVFLMGVCPTTMAADSFFMTPPASSLQDFSTETDFPRGFLKSIISTDMSDISYTPESLPEYETFLTPVTSLRRIHMRAGYRNSLLFSHVYDISAYIFESYTAFHGHFFDEIASNTVIVRYIHHQDGSKVSFSPLPQL